MTKQEPIQDHYSILGLPVPRAGGQNVEQHEIKAAYRRALLDNHPDKSKASGKANFDPSKYTVDQIARAYKILSDATSRIEYDRSVALCSPIPGLTTERPHPGLETVDLDDLVFDQMKNTWYRGCRCGNERGFLISEEDLEKDTEHGEIVTGCRGCSLWLRVTFAMAEDG